MQVDTRCPKCETELRVAADLLGQKVRCPNCEFVFLVKLVEHRGPTVAQEDVASPKGEGEKSVASREVVAEPTVSQWYLRIPEGRVFGPVEEGTLDHWVSEGRVSAACELRVSDNLDWSSACEKYPQLSEAGNPFRQVRVSGVPMPLEPHRGMLVFGLSLAGCFVPLLSLWPAVLGTRDLKRMNAGQMDPAGDHLTRSGQAIAMVSSLVWIGAFGIAMLVLMIQLFSVG